jgi:hypothetical protein
VIRCAEKINEGETVRVEMIGAHDFYYREKVIVVKDFGGFYKCRNKHGKECLLLDIEVEKIKVKPIFTLLKLKKFFMRKIISIVFISFLFSCTNQTSKTSSFVPKSDTLLNTLCVYKVNDSTVTVGYLSRIVRDTLLLQQDSVKFEKDSSKANISFSKKWIKDTSYFISIALRDSVTKQTLKNKNGGDSSGFFLFNYSNVIADCNKNVFKVLQERKLKIK